MKEQKQKAEADDTPAPKKMKAEKMPTESTDMNGNTDTNQLKVTVLLISDLV